MSPRIKSTIKFILFLSIGLLLLYLAFRNVPMKKFTEDMKEARYGWVAFSLFFSVIALFSRAYRWGMLIEPMARRPKLSNLFYAVCSGYLANLAFPRLGEVTRCTALYEAEGSSFDVLVGTVIAERIVDLLTLILLIFLTILSNMQLFGHYFSEMLSDKLAALGRLSFSHLMLAGVLALMVLFLLWLFRKRLLAHPLAVKALNFLKGIVSGLQSVLRLRRKGVFVFHSLLIWFLYYLCSYVGFFAIPETSGLGPGAALFILVLGGLGMSAPVQGGIGVYHLMVASGLLLYGINHEKGMLFASIALFSQWALILLLGLVSVLMLNIEKRKQLNRETAS